MSRVVSRGGPLGVLLGVHRVGLARAGEDRRFLLKIYRRQIS